MSTEAQSAKNADARGALDYPDAALYAALAAAQAEMPAVTPDKLNPHFKSKFVSLDHLIAKTRPVLNKHGLAIVQLPRRGADGQPELRTRITHVAGGSLVEDAPLLPGKQDMQGLGAAITYMRRFAWASACGIVSETDDDGESIASHTRQEATGAAGKPADPPSGTPAPPKPQNGSQAAELAKRQKEAHALHRELTDAAIASGGTDPDKAAQAAADFETQFRSGIKALYGTEHINELDAAQLASLIVQLRNAKRQVKT